MRAVAKGGDHQQEHRDVAGQGYEKRPSQAILLLLEEK
jgi:hypothetical protein